MMMFPQEMNIWFSRLSKADSPPQCGWASSHPWRAGKKQKGTGKVNSLFLLELRALYFPAFFLRPSNSRICTSYIPPPQKHTNAHTHIHTSPLALLRLSDWGWITPLTFLLLQLAEIRSWDFLPSLTRWVNSYNLFLYTPIYVLSIQFL